jgi:hypothetical protein
LVSLIGRRRDEIVDRRQLRVAVHVAIENAEILEMGVAVAEPAIERE